MSVAGTTAGPGAARAAAANAVVESPAIPPSSAAPGNEHGDAHEARMPLPRTAPRGQAAPPSPRRLRMQQVITAAIVFGPLAGVVVATVGLLGRGVTVLDVVLAVVFFAISGHGLTAGFHRMLAHRSFKAARGVKVALAVAGSLGIEGSVIAWVANHRRHHAYTDRAGDPHSPYEYGTGARAQIRGAVHAHVGWLFQSQPTEELRWAPDLLRDSDLALVSRLFPLLAVSSLAAPAMIAWGVSGTWSGAWGGLVWGGLVRVFVLHHVTFAVNSACHLWGRRPFVTREADRATNFAPLAVLAMGENWHNLHHSCPALARHGAERGQLDSTARLIWLLERAGVVWDVRWPGPGVVDARRRKLSPPGDPVPSGPHPDLGGGDGPVLRPVVVHRNSVPDTKNL